MAWNNPDSFHINTGAVASGSVSDTWTDNAVRHVLNEVSGTPGFDYEYWFESIPAGVNYVRLRINGYYVGNPAHIVYVQVWDFLASTWVDEIIMNDASADADYYSGALYVPRFSSGGQLKVRFYHPASGNINHYQYNDYIFLEDLGIATTPVPTTTLTTAAPTTAAPTTAPPSTVVPTTTLTTPVPTTTLTTPVPTTLPPTPAPIEIDPEPIEISLSFYSVASFYPAAPVNTALDQSAEFDPIEIILGVEGLNPDTGITLSAVGLNIEILGTLVGGQVIDAGPIPIEFWIAPSFVTVQRTKCNFVKWAKIGALDFTIDESNIAGERPVDWKGCIWHLAKHRNTVIAYGENGVTVLSPSGVSWGAETVYPIGLKNKGAFVGDESTHLFVDNTGKLVMITDKIEQLDYSEFLGSMGLIMMSLDQEQKLVYICDGTTGYIFSIGTRSFGQGPENISGIQVQSGNLLVVSDGEIVTPKLEICTDIYDFGIRKPKTLTQLEIGTNATENLYVSVDYRTSYKDEFKQIGWHLVNPDGKAHPKCYGVEFRFRLKSTIYEFIKLDYIKVRGHVHGFSYLDSMLDD